MMCASTKFLFHYLHMKDVTKVAPFLSNYRYKTDAVSNRSNLPINLFVKYMYTYIILFCRLTLQSSFLTTNCTNYLFTSLNAISAGR